MLSKNLKSQVLLVCLLLSSLVTQAGPRGHYQPRDNDRGRNSHESRRDQRNYNPPSSASHSYGEGTDATDDSALIEAMQRGRTVQFLMAVDLEVVQLLADDNSGLRHQKWIVRLSNGQKVQAVYNSDMCPRVPVKVGDRVALAGMFLMTGQGGLMHWLHHDPSGRRADGFVELNGQRYCDK